MAKARLNFDNYPTPEHLSGAMTTFVHELYPNKSIIIEPACGSGSFLKKTKELWPQAMQLGIDIIDYKAQIESLGVSFVQADNITYMASLGQQWLNENTLVITNPQYGGDGPQRLVEEISKHGRPGCHVALLLRQAFLGGIGRALHFKERDSLRIKRDVAGRPKFNSDSKSQDHSEYAVFIYEIGYHGHYLGWNKPLIWMPKHQKHAEFAGKLP